MSVGLSKTTIFADLCGHFFENVRDKTSNITWRYATPCLPVIDCKMNVTQNDLECQFHIKIRFRPARLSRAYLCVSQTFLFITRKLSFPHKIKLKTTEKEQNSHFPDEPKLASSILDIPCSSVHYLQVHWLGSGHNLSYLFNINPPHLLVFIFITICQFTQSQLCLS